MSEEKRNLAERDKPQDSAIVKTLRAHWLRTIVCHHAISPDDKTWDRAECACSEVNLPQMDTVGEAVETWIQHIRVVAAIEYPAQQAERDPQAQFLAKYNGLCPCCENAKVTDSDKGKEVPCPYRVTGELSWKLAERDKRVQNEK